MASEPDSFSPVEMCAIVSEAADFHLTPKILRQWRNRSLLAFAAATGSGWPRYSEADAFETVAMAELLRAGYSVGTAAAGARMVRTYGPTHPRWKRAHAGEALVLPGTVSVTDEDTFSFPRIISCTFSELGEKLANARAFNARAWIVIDLGHLTERFQAAVAGARGSR